MDTLSKAVSNKAVDKKPSKKAVEKIAKEKAVVTPLNLKNEAYQQASFTDSLSGIARKVYAVYPNFDEKQSDEAKVECYLGYKLRIAENQPKISQFFIVEKGAYFPVDQLAFDNHKGEKYYRTVAGIMSYTPQSFGALRLSNPQLHAIIKTERDQVSKYCSNRFNDLKKAVKAIKNEGVARVRGATKTFGETVKESLDSLKKKCVNAVARGDTTADHKKLITAISEFNRKWLV